MDFREYLKQNVVYLDGGMGTLLQKKGILPTELPEEWNLTHPDEIVAIHRSYFDAGCNVMFTNTFGANILNFDEETLTRVVKAAVENAKRARNESTSTQEKFIALDIGPTGKMLKPLGSLAFEDAVSIFKRTVELGVKCGVDLVVCETFSDSYETKAALLAVKECCDLPVIVTNAYGADGKLMTGASPEAMVALLEGMGVDALGANCSLGPEQLCSVAQRLLASASVPVVIKPNAGLPTLVEGKTVYNVTPCQFSEAVRSLINMGVRVVGGCCGTTPDYISELVRKTHGIKAQPISDKGRTVVSSYTHALEIGDSPVLIGERINPTGKKRFREALAAGDMDYVLGEAVRQEECGAHALDVNVGTPEVDEVEMLPRVVAELQSVTALPLQLDTSNPTAMEAALRIYNGKPLINSVNGKAESMRAIFPLAKKYGGVVVALTLDENGIPETAQGRVDIAKRVLATAGEYGIMPKDIVFDTLAMAVSADPSAARVSLEALRIITEELGCHTSLGVSNISFGLPVRDAINSSFFAMALASGLSAAIMNPYSADMMRTYYASRALLGKDEHFADYTRVASSFDTVNATRPAAYTAKNDGEDTLSRAIIKGLCDRAAALCEELLKSKSALDIINGEIIPALDTVGEGYERGEIYLPGLLISAEAAKSSFEVIKSHSDKGVSPKKLTVVLATVEGDIHDIGKNIVKLIFENYGYRVVDLGKDVAAEQIVAATLETGASVVGLSALMTTTLPAMENTVKMLRSAAPCVKIMVGGAVLTSEFAEKIGADKYAKDAMDAIRWCEGL